MTLRNWQQFQHQRNVFFTLFAVQDDEDDLLWKYQLKISAKDRLHVCKRTPEDAANVKSTLEEFGDHVEFMKNRETGEKGFVMRTYFAPEGSLEIQP